MTHSSIDPLAPERRDGETVADTARRLLRERDEQRAMANDFRERLRERISRAAERLLHRNEARTAARRMFAVLLRANRDAPVLTEEGEPLTDVLAREYPWLSTEKGKHR